MKKGDRVRYNNRFSSINEEVGYLVRSCSGGDTWIIEMENDVGWSRDHDIFPDYDSIASDTYWHSSSDNLHLEPDINLDTPYKKELDELIRDCRRTIKSIEDGDV